MDIYNISDWATSVNYLKNDIVMNNGYYYYAISDHTSGSFDADLSAGKWNGVLNYNGQTLPYFFWIPSYGYNMDIKPFVKSVKFGDGYEQITPDGINNILLPFNLSFENRDLKEYTAILHFFHTRGGHEKFYFIPPQPFNLMKKFICSNWRPTQIFYDNYNIDALFEEKI